MYKAEIFYILMFSILISCAFLLRAHAIFGEYTIVVSDVLIVSSLLVVFIPIVINYVENYLDDWADKHNLTQHREDVASLNKTLNFFYSVNEEEVVKQIKFSDKKEISLSEMKGKYNLHSLFKGEQATQRVLITTSNTICLKSFAHEEIVVNEHYHKLATEIIYVLDGMVDVAYENNEMHHLKKNDWIQIPPTKIHRITFHQGCDCLLLWEI